MSKKDQTKKAPKKQKGISIETKPFNSEEIKELQLIVKQPLWKRRKLKDEFIAAHNRLPEEVNKFMWLNGRRKRTIKESPGSMAPPRATDTTRDVRDTTKRKKTGHMAYEGDFSLRREGNEVKVTGFKSFRMEGGSLIIETD